MRKQTKLAVLVSAAALLSAGAAMTAFAGWQQEEDGRWYYLDRDGYMVENVWKPNNGQMFWLGEDGYMETNFLVEDDDGNYYYVDETGAMVTNQWRAIDNEDYYDTGDESEDEYHWYYFQGSGKAYKNPSTADGPVWRTINGKKYTFNSEGQMLHGWINESGEALTGDDAYKSGLYYCGSLEDGARRTSQWERLDVSDDGPGAGNNEQEPNDDGCAWFWFQANGKKAYATPNDLKKANTISKTISGQKYRFDQDGLMVSGWVDLATAPASNSKGFYRTDDRGQMYKGWFKAVPSVALDSSANADDSAKWFYANNDGTLKHDEMFTISNKRYAFNSKGEMLSGLQALKVTSDYKITVLPKYNEAGTVSLDTVAKIDAVGRTDEKSLEALGYDGYDVADDPVGLSGYRVYYFGGGDDGALKTGNQTISVDGDNYQFLFNKTSSDGGSKGEGARFIPAGSGNKAIYSNGRKIKADSDARYVAVNATTCEVKSFKELYGQDTTVLGQYVVVNTSGSIQKNGNRKDADGYIAETDGNGYIKSKIRVDN